MIGSFKDRDTERLWAGERVRRFQAFERQALRRLNLLSSAARIEDLIANPGNQLHSLGGDRRGQYAIRINLQWRVCFRWDGGAKDVEITDYH